MNGCVRVSVCVSVCACAPLKMNYIPKTMWRERRGGSGVSGCCQAQCRDDEVMLGEQAKQMARGSGILRGWKKQEVADRQRRGKRKTGINQMDMKMKEGRREEASFHGCSSAAARRVKTNKSSKCCSAERSCCELKSLPVFPLKYEVFHTSSIHTHLQPSSRLLLSSCLFGKKQLSKLLKS